MNTSFNPAFRPIELPPALAEKETKTSQALAKYLSSTYLKPEKGGCIYDLAKANKVIFN